MAEFAVVLGGLFGLLSRYCGNQQNFSVGTIVGDRNREELERCIGFFAQTVPIPYPKPQKEGDSWSFSELVRLSSDSFFDGIAHMIPFSKLISELKLERDPSISPLFQVLFVYNKNALQEGSQWKSFESDGNLLQGALSSPVQLPSKTVKFEVEFAFTETPSAAGLDIALSIGFSTKLFRRETIEQMGRHFVALLSECLKLENHQAKLDAIEFLSDDEKRSIVAGVGMEKKVWKESDSLVHELFEAQVAKNPKAIAVETDTDSICYADLNSKAEAVKKQLLSELGVSENETIGICLPRSIQLLATILGVLKSGCCYLPLDPSFPAERLQYMLEDAKAKALIVDQSLLKIFGLDKPGTESGLSAIVVVHWEGKYSIHDSSKPLLKPEKKSLSKKEQQSSTNKATKMRRAVMFYTSGSTGKPKGMRLTHRIVVNLLLGFREYDPLNVGDRSGLFIAYSFDPSVLAIFHTFERGAVLCVPTGADQFEPLYMKQFVESKRVDLIVTAMTTAVLLMEQAKASPRFADSLSAEKPSPCECTNLRRSASKTSNGFSTCTALWRHSMARSLTARKLR